MKASHVNRAARTKVAGKRTTRGRARTRAGTIALTAVRGESSEEGIYDRLVAAIFEHRLPPGTKLGEGEVGALFQVSRTVVRAALQMLSFEGLVRTERNRGAFVANPSADEVRDMLEAMGALEAVCGELACARATDAEIAAIRRQHDRMAKAYERRDRHTYFKLNQEIHHRIARMCGNATLQRLHETLNARLYRVRFMSNRTDRWQTAIEEHEAIADALERRDVRAVRRLLREHLGQTWKKVKAHGF